MKVISLVKKWWKSYRVYQVTLTLPGLSFEFGYVLCHKQGITNRMVNSVVPDEMAHCKLSNQTLFAKASVLPCKVERLNVTKYSHKRIIY